MTDMISRPRHVMVIGCVALLGLAACAQTATTTPGEPTPQAVSMKRALANVARIRAYIYGASPQGDAVAAAAELDGFARGLPALFPPGQASNEYVDMSSARVRAAPQAMARTVQGLSAAVATGERARVAEALEDVERDGCGACHRPAAAPNG